MSNALVSLTTKLAQRLDMGDGSGLIETLKATAFKGQVTDAQMTALMVVANQYGLNPWTRELYAFPDKNNGIVPVVGVDGWSRIMNDHPQFDGIEFAQDNDKCTCTIYRKDRSHPVSATEYMDECKRGTQPWQSHPRRMLRHKAMIQCARLAFGFGGIYDQDEAERIVETTGTIIDGTTGEVINKSMPKALPDYSNEQLERMIPAWKEAINTGKTTPEKLVAVISSKYRVSAEQSTRIHALRNQSTHAQNTSEGDTPNDDFVAAMEAEERRAAQ
jgi:phage recombination protein Bet